MFDIYGALYDTNKNFDNLMFLLAYYVYGIFTAIQCQSELEFAMLRYFKFNIIVVVKMRWMCKYRATKTRRHIFIGYFVEIQWKANRMSIACMKMIEPAMRNR